MNAFDLSGRVALVTGGNGGIGLGIAKGMAEAGATIVVAARNPEKNAAALAELSALGAPCHALEVDVSDEAACRGMAQAAHDRFGRLDILVNNAGVARSAPPGELGLEVWNEVVQTNLTAAFVACQGAYPLMKAQGGGKIINIASVYAYFGSPQGVPYAASKAGLLQVTTSLAVAWAADNIQVNSLIVGCVETDMTRRMKSREPEHYAALTARTPAGRWGLPDDLAGPAVFLASAAADFVTGSALTVDGGFSIFL